MTEHSHASSRRRHPAATAWRPDRARFTEAMARRLADRPGVRYPRVAAAVLSARGATGEPRPTFASRLGLSEASVAALESGTRAAIGVPPVVRDASPWVDWRALVSAVDGARD